MKGADHRTSPPASAVLRLGDLIVLAAAFGVALLVSGLSRDVPDLATFLAIRVKLGNVLLLLGFAAVWLGVLETFGLYRHGDLGASLAGFSQLFKATALGTLLVPALALVFRLEAVSRSFTLTFFVTVLLGASVLRLSLYLLRREVRRRGSHLRNVIIVGSGPRGSALGEQVRKRPDLGYLLLGYVDDLPAPANPCHGGREKLLGTLAEIEQVLTGHAVDEVLVGLPVKSYYGEIARIISLSEDLGVTVRMPADFFPLEAARTELNYLGGLPIMTVKTPRPSFGGLLLKRVFDLALASLLLLLALPAIVVIAACIKLDSQGPLFFGQLRVGLNRRPFRMLKFRTMVVGAERQQAELEARNEVAGAAFKIKDDPRVTRVGRVLRRFSLDELPQLWNVLKGEMSIVGPRPLPARDVEAFSRRWQNRRFSVKPGLTCLWQANGRHDIAFDEWMELDLQYIDQWSFGLDLEIVLKTVPSVIRGTGAS